MLLITADLITHQSQDRRLEYTVGAGPNKAKMQLLTTNSALRKVKREAGCLKADQWSNYKTVIPIKMCKESRY